MQPGEALPDIKDHPDVLKACQHIANLVGDFCSVPSVLLMRQNNDSMEVVISSSHPSTPYRPGDKESLNSGLYCEAVISTQFPLHVPDALNDPEWCNNPDIELGMIAYYGVPVNWPDGTPFGTFCILDRKERPCPLQEQRMVREFAEVIETLLQQIVAKVTLRHMADHDDLTSLLNRSAFLNRLDEELHRVERYRSPMSLIYLDVDHFKEINDEYGHLVGDLVLQHFSAIIQTQCRLPDILGRLGGEEFALCVPEADIGEAAKLAERIRAKVEGTPIIIGDTPMHISISAGVVEARQEDTLTDGILNRADKAMYEAKQAGRNQIKIG